MYADDVSLFAQHNDNALVLLQQALTVLRNGVRKTKCYPMWAAAATAATTTIFINSFEAYYWMAIPEKKNI